MSTRPYSCRLTLLATGLLTPDGQQFGIGFELRPPVQWNGRFAFQCGGGLDGVLHPALGDVNGSISPSALARDRIIATGAALPGAERRLCPYPRIARYEGGDPNSERSFVCRE